MNRNSTDALSDQLAITRLQRDWGLWRDTRQWGPLRASYAPNAWMRTTWFDGPAEDFVNASIALAAKPALALHFIGPSTIQLLGDRAIAETRMQLLLRDRLHGVEVDVTCVGRFIDRLVRLDGAWKILRREPVYEKDSLATVQPGQALMLDRAALDAYPEGYRHVAYLQSQGGARIVHDLAAHNSEAQHRLYEAAAAWLREGAAET